MNVFAQDPWKGTEYDEVEVVPQMDIFLANTVAEPSASDREENEGATNNLEYELCIGAKNRQE